MRTKTYNFSAGPATLPTSVLARVQQECLDWNKGMSVMEVSHRSKEFVALTETIEQRLRNSLSIPTNYKVLFLQGGATTQFAMVPLNLLRGKKQADYFCTGAWSQKAIEEAKRYCDVNIVSSSEHNKFTTISPVSEWNLNKEAAFCHYTPNETIHGVEFQDIPDTGDVPLVADMSSTLLSRPVDVSRFALIYAGAQKNIGPAGLTVVIIRDDLLGGAAESCPGMLNYQNHVDNDSMYNTPPTFIWYVIGLVFEWIEQSGGLAAMAEHNRTKAERLYSFIDNSAFYRNPVEKQYRSWMNVPFMLDNAVLDAKFLQEAENCGLRNLSGHRSVGGMRASIYNAMPMEGVDALCAFMQDFANDYVN